MPVEFMEREEKREGRERERERERERTQNEERLLERISSVRGV